MVIGQAPAGNRSLRIDRELLYALERARSRLAVAIAAENKATPRGRWHQYLETENRTRRCVREIRRQHRGPDPQQAGWLQALDLLNQPLSAADRENCGTAQLLCQRLSEVLKILEEMTYNE